MLDKSTKRKYTVPYGMCVWSTGVAPRKLTYSMMQSLQQCHDKRAYVTNLLLMNSIYVHVHNYILAFYRVEIIILYFYFINRRALLTDQYLRVKGSKGIFALGDCSTIEQNKMIAKANELFRKGDVNGDGQLTLEEFTRLIEIAKKEYPQVSLFFQKAQKNIHR